MNSAQVKGNSLLLYLTLQNNFMRKSRFTLLLSFLFITSELLAQGNADPDYFVSKKNLKATPVKNQANTGTCWCFSTTSLFESQCLRSGCGELDLSEMFTVRNIYLEKARNYLLRQGSAQFAEGGLGHDAVRAIATYGTMPESVYSGLLKGQTAHNHSKMVEQLKNFLDSIMKKPPVSLSWEKDFTTIIDNYMGPAPAAFSYNGKEYTPKTFAKQVMKFDPSEYINITSFTHHPFYSGFILEQPDNFSNGVYYNLPVDEMTELVKQALAKGYSVMWDTDVSNEGWIPMKGFAIYPAEGLAIKSAAPSSKEGEVNAEKRQQLFESLVTTDDHLMHITGMETGKDGKHFFRVKNSWGAIGPENGYVLVSESYFRMNTISLVLPKAAFDKKLLSKLGL